MEVKTLYRYQRSDGGETVSTQLQQANPVVTTHRIIAGPGMAITRDGINLYAVVDTDMADGWYECVAPTSWGASQLPEDPLDPITVIVGEELLATLVMTHINTLPVDDATALRWQELYPVWIPGVNYTAGDKARFNNKLYRCLQDHTSQADWTPEAAPSLFAKVLIPDETVIPDWEQPDSTNGYSTGDKVAYNGKIYVSLVDHNVWSPEAYPAAWAEVV